MCKFAVQFSGGIVSLSSFDFTVKAAKKSLPAALFIIAFSTVKNLIQFYSGIGLLWQHNLAVKAVGDVVWDRWNSS
jgi:hypothetical protein